MLEIQGKPWFTKRNNQEYLFGFTIYNFKYVKFSKNVSDINTSNYAWNNHLRKVNNFKPFHEYTKAFLVYVFKNRIPRDVKIRFITRENYYIEKLKYKDWFSDQYNLYPFWDYKNY